MNIYTLYAYYDTTPVVFTSLENYSGTQSTAYNYSLAFLKIRSFNGNFKSLLETGGGLRTEMVVMKY